MNLIDRNKIESNTRRFTDADTEFRFLLGGIGTGSISVGNRGQLCDWEIFNKPNKNTPYPYTFFSLFSRFEGEKGEVRILESRLREPFSRPVGYASYEMAGIPRFDRAELYGRGPFVNVGLSADKLPLTVNMTAFSPLIPGNEEDSGIPAVCFRYTVGNEGDKPCEISVCATQSNFTSCGGFDLFGNMIVKDEQKNEFFDDGKIRGLIFSSKAPENSRRYGTMCLSTPCRNYTFKPEWLAGGWWDGAHDFFNEFAADGKLSYNSADSNQGEGRLEFVVRLKTGSLACGALLQPGEKAEFEFVLSWCFPNRPKSWEGHVCPARDCGDEIVKNYYSYRFPDALSAAKYFYGNYDRLYGDSLNFADALFSSDADKWIIDAVNGTLSVLRSTTCFRIGREGTFLCWEGCFDHAGSCEGNCTHVWNYAQTLAFLFPRLEQNMRRTEFLLETDEDGNMAFRTMQVFGDKKWDMLPAADGQMGCIVRLYRDWKFSGDDDLLRECYPKMKKALDFAFSYWDSDGDCVLDSRQHNTYDIEFYGESSLTNSIFFAALKAGSAMARRMGDDEAAERWLAAFEKGSERMDKKLYRNGYYVQVIDDVDKYKYQYGDGCLSDQIFGQTLAHIDGLGYILPEEHVKSAVRNIFRYNFREDFSSHLNVQRVYALNDEKGLLVCSWPEGTKRPRLPFVYSDEVWTGIEYQVATCLLYEGYEKEALEIVKGVRMRYDGKNRNPFNEVECGNHYARSLASYGLLLAYSGFGFDMTRGEISFRARKEAYTTFFTTAQGFGLCRIDGTNYEVQMLCGTLDGIKIKIDREGAR